MTSIGSTAGPIVCSDEDAAMLFQAVLFTVIAYLVACYAYGVYLLWKLYVGRKFHENLGQAEGLAPLDAADAAPSKAPPAPAQPSYEEAPAKAA